MVPGDNRVAAPIDVNRPEVENVHVATVAGCEMLCSMGDSVPFVTLQIGPLTVCLPATTISSAAELRIVARLTLRQVCPVSVHLQ